MKCALFIGARLAVILRDDDPAIPFPGLWDLPGGGREPGERVFDTLRRETQEELGLTLRREHLLWSRWYPSALGGALPVVFCVAHVPASAAHCIRFGNEGQRWALMAPADYMSHPRAIPHLAARLAIWLGRAGES